MKKLSLLITALLLAGGFAKAELSALKLTLANGTEHTYNLGAKPVITFVGEDMKISANDVTTSYPKANIKSMVFVESKSALNDALLEGSATYTYENGVFSCPGHKILVFSSSGAQVLAGTDTVALLDLAPGVYIIKTNNHSIKILKR